MRTALGYSGAVTRAEALAALTPGGAPAPQVATVGSSTLAGADYLTTDPAGSGAGATTADDAKLHNATMEEIVCVLDLAGLAPDPDDNTQLAQVLAPAVNGIVSHATDTGTIETVNKRGVIASYAAKASGEGAVVEGFIGAAMGGPGECSATASGAHSAVRATGGFAATGLAADATGAGAVIDGTNPDYYSLLASGAGSAIRATNCSVRGGGTASGRAAVIDGCDTDYDYSTYGGAVVASGRASRVVASARATASGKFASIASALGVVASGVGAFVRGCFASPGKTLTVSGAYSGALACNATDDMDVSDANSLAVCSVGYIPAPSAAQQMYGGVDGARKARIDFLNGRFYAASTAPDDAGFATAENRAVNEGGAAAAFNSAGADYAEWFRRASHDGTRLPAGTIITRRRTLVMPAGPGDLILGVVSRNAMIAGNAREDGSQADDPNWCLVGLMGQLEVQVDETITNEAIDHAEDAHLVLCVRPAANGLGTLAEYGQDGAMPTRLQAMEVIRPGVCLCLLR